MSDIMRHQDRAKIGAILVERGWTRNPTGQHHFTARNTFDKGGFTVTLTESRQLTVQTRTEDPRYIIVGNNVTIPSQYGKGWHTRTVDLISTCVGDLL